MYVYIYYFLIYLIFLEERVLNFPYNSFLFQIYELIDVCIYNTVQLKYI